MVSTATNILIESIELKLSYVQEKIERLQILLAVGSKVVYREGGNDMVEDEGKGGDIVMFSFSQ